MSFFAQALATIIGVVDPLGIAPIFIALTPGMQHATKLRVMRNAVFVALVILLAFAALGRILLQSLGITLPAFYISGGILLMLIAIDQLFARTSRTRETPEEESEALLSPDISVFPLAIPILSGPGAIATVILYMSLAGTDVGRIVAVLGSIVVALVASYAAMRVSGVVVRLLGATGIHVISRIIGILLAALGVQFVLNGIASYYHILAH
ncbi:MAG: MarC family protein [Chloroflexota bacterium]